MSQHEHSEFKKIIGPVENPLLIRYRLIRLPFLGIFVHHIMRSDHDRALHDHPWNFVSVILKGSYIEHTPQGMRAFGRGRILVRPAHWLHRLQLEQPVWTLVLVGSRFRRWGFLTPKGWCWWKKYNDQTGLCEE